MSTTYVCPRKDIVCGEVPANWCSACPKKFDSVDTNQATDSTKPSEREELTPERLADLTPLGATVIEGEDGKPRGVMMTYAQLKEFAADLLEADGKAGGEVAWRTQAAKWLRRKAEDQQRTNEQHPQHVKAYPSWEQRVLWLTWLAQDLEAEQESAPPGLEPWQDDTRPQQAAQVAQPLTEEQGLNDVRQAIRHLQADECEWDAAMALLYKAVGKQYASPSKFAGRPVGVIAASASAAHGIGKDQAS